jgi:ATP-dependent Clp protease, protease subunit
MTRDDIDQVLLQKGIMTLFGDIDSEQANTVIRYIWAWNNIPECQDSPLTLIVNSNGGDLNDAFAIVDAIRISKAPVHTLAIGKACSSGLIIAMSGTHGHREIARNTCVMSHQYQTTFDGKVHEWQGLNRGFAITNQQVIEHYMEHTGLSKKAVQRKLLPATDIWITPTEAVALGLFDRIKQ